MREWKNAISLTLLLAVCSLSVWQTALAQTPLVFRDNVLKIPDAVVIEGDQILHYRDIELALEPDGSFVISKAEEGTLASVASVTVVRHDDGVDVVAQGYRTACVEIQPAAVSQKGNTFIIAIPESIPRSDVCILIAVHFEVTTTLDVEGLAAGDYEVVVNGKSAGFTL